MVLIALLERTGFHACFEREMARGRILPNEIVCWAFEGECSWLVAWSKKIPLVSKDIYWDCPGVGLNDCRDPRIRGGIILREEYAQRTLRNPSPILLEIRLLRDLFSLIICIKLWYLVVTKLLRWNSCSVLKSFHLPQNKLTLVPSPICQ